MIIKESVIRSLCETDPPCKRRQETVTVNNVVAVCSTCLKVVHLAAQSKRAICPVCSSIYDTTSAPLVKFVSRAVVVEEVQTPEGGLDSGIEDI